MSTSNLNINKKYVILLRYHEIALKGWNRRWFEEVLISNVRKAIQTALGLNAKIEIKRYQGRIAVESDWNEAVRMSLSRVFGLAGFSPARVVPTNLDDVLKFTFEEFGERISKAGLPKTFRVLTRRSDKVLPETSAQIDAFIGGHIHDAYPSLAVDLKHPELTLGIEIRKDYSWIWLDKYAGAGGLPVGTNSKLLCLISGGLDSPVAAIQLMKRGAEVAFVHFHGAPFVGREALEKVEELVRIVNQFQPEPHPLIVIPFGGIQEQIARVTSSRIRTVLYRRMMIRIAEQIASNLGAKALVTGESLGQVASQTIENITTINSVAKLPILRPLIAYDKDEIIKKAKQFGTFETSIKPAADSCVLFADNHPILRSTAAKAEEQERNFDIAAIIKSLQLSGVS